MAFQIKRVRNDTLDILLLDTSLPMHLYKILKLFYSKQGTHYTNKLISNITISRFQQLKQHKKQASWKEISLHAEDDLWILEDMLLAARWQTILAILNTKLKTIHNDFCFALFLKVNLLDDLFLKPEVDYAWLMCSTYRCLYFWAWFPLCVYI